MLVLMISLAALQAGPPALELPVECTIGTTCFIQQYVDHDPGPGITDYKCGAQSYDGHKGTDFRILSLDAMKEGVPVLASAGGRVRAVRDGEPDVFARDRGAEALEGRECGNGIVIDHEDGWQTQYCHLRQGSVRVRPGQQIAAGETLGLVGLSGKADFPHVHLSVRQGKKVIDPFAVSDEGLAACGTTAGALWTESAATAVAYRDVSILNAGFADGQVDGRGIEEGAGIGFALTSDKPALVVFARMINAKEGDRLRLSIDGPQGFSVTSTADPAPRHQAQRVAFAGRKRPEGGWPRGEYRGVVEVVRDGEVIDRREVTLRYE